MTARDYITTRQRLWAKRRGIRLGGQYRYDADPRQRERGEKNYVFPLRDNLFSAIDAATFRSYQEAEGHEIQQNDPRLGKMYALHSSSALCCNLLHYWRGQPGSIASAFAGGRCDVLDLKPEAEAPIFPDRSVAHPSLDAMFRKRSGGLLAVESKMSEPFGNREHRKLAESYILADGIWSGLENLKTLAKRVFDDVRSFKHVDAAQLVTHVLGLSRCPGKSRFTLVYAWYDVPGPEGSAHLREIMEVQEVMTRDHVDFRLRTHQEVIVDLASRYRADHQNYVDYMVERYL